MMKSIYLYLCLLLSITVGICSSTAQSLPSQVLANPQNEMAGKVVFTGTRDAPPLAKNTQHAQRLADAIFNNDLHLPFQHATYSELQTWMATAVLPYHETYQSILSWNGSSVSEITTLETCLLAPQGRELYCGTDGVRQVVQFQEGDFFLFAVYPSNTDNTRCKRFRWMRPHGALILYPLVWLAPCGLQFSENALANGAYELTGSTSATDSPILDVYLKTVPNHPERVQEIRYHHRDTDSPGNWLIQGQFSNHQSLSPSVSFPGTIVWILRFIPLTESFPDVSVPITYDPTQDSRHVLTLSSFDFGPKDELFPNHFLPEVPAECRYIDERYPMGTPERIDPTLADYRTVAP